MAKILRVMDGVDTTDTETDLGVTTPANDYIYVTYSYFVHTIVSHTCQPSVIRTESPSFRHR